MHLNIFLQIYPKENPSMVDRAENGSKDMEPSEGPLEHPNHTAHALRSVTLSILHLFSLIVSVRKLTYCRCCPVLVPNALILEINKLQEHILAYGKLTISRIFKGLDKGMK